MFCGVRLLTRLVAFFVVCWCLEFEMLLNVQKARVCGMPHRVVVKNQAIKLVSAFIIFIVFVVLAFHFISPFFGHHWIRDCERENFGITRQIGYKNGQARASHNAFSPFLLQFVRQLCIGI